MGTGLSVSMGTLLPVDEDEAAAVGREGGLPPSNSCEAITTTMPACVVAHESVSCGSVGGWVWVGVHVCVCGCVRREGRRGTGGYSEVGTSNLRNVIPAPRTRSHHLPCKHTYILNHSWMQSSGERCLLCTRRQRAWRNMTRRQRKVQEESSGKPRAHKLPSLAVSCSSSPSLPSLPPSSTPSL